MDALVETVKEKLNKRSLFPKSQWIQQFIQSNNSKTEDWIANALFQQFLIADIKDITDSRLPNIEKLHKTILSGTWCLQIDEFLNISENFERRNQVYNSN